VVTGPADPNWPSAATLLSDQVRSNRVNVALLGVPTYETSLSPRSVGVTPRALRRALARLSTWSWSDMIDLAECAVIVDYGDVADPDTTEGHRRVKEALQRIDPRCELIAVVGGDNALTQMAMRYLAGPQLASWGLITLDAHHDLRDGSSNGSPVRQLLDAGLPASQVVQVGIADFANSPFYARRAITAGISVVSRDVLRHRPLETVLDEALAVAGAGGGPIYVDVDLDVADRAVVPACPAALPGGLSADELRRAVRHLGRSPLVHAIDFTEVDSERDGADQRTVRLLALLLLEAVSAAAGRER
jgi:formiminoglutamase